MLTHIASVAAPALLRAITCHVAPLAFSRYRLDMARLSEKQFRIEAGLGFGHAKAAAQAGNAKAGHSQPFAAPSALAECGKRSFERSTSGGIE